MSFIKRVLGIALLALVSLLSACGGSTGFPPVITGVKVQTLKYGNTATVYLGGKDLRSSITVESNGGCTNPSFASNSTTDTLVLNCVVKLVGDVPLTFKAEDGSVIYTTTLTVPKPQVTLFTTKGTVVLELDPSTAPISSNNYLSYVSKGFYTSTLFHRVISGFMIQGGGYTTGMVKKTGQAAAIELESNKGLSNLRGTLAMARTDVFNSATSEFFINVVDNTFLDYKTEASPGYAVFGKVVQGMDVVDAIVAQPTGVSNGFADVPLTDVVISLALQTQ
jgi:cyclophilin family peptidyl-prolyl cis-trans isomerase